MAKHDRGREARATKAHAPGGSERRGFDARALCCKLAIAGPLFGSPMAARVLGSRASPARSPTGTLWSPCSAIRSDCRSRTPRSSQRTRIGSRTASAHSSRPIFSPRRMWSIGSLDSTSPRRCPNGCANVQQPRSRGCFCATLIPPTLETVDDAEVRALVERLAVSQMESARSRRGRGPTDHDNRRSRSRPSSGEAGAAVAS